MSEREDLERALADHGDAPWQPAMELIITAARKHLKTLPKPTPKFQVVGQLRSGGRETDPFRYNSRDCADEWAADWMRTGKYNSVAVEQVSP